MLKKIISLLVVAVLLSTFTSFASSNMSTDNGKLIFASTVIRHGDRAPYVSVKTDQLKWEWGLGNLTPVGMSQEVITGKYLGDEYIEKYKLLPNLYKTSQVKITADTSDRVIQSVLCVFMGMYPASSGPKLAKDQYAIPNGLQVPAIHTKASNKNLYLDPNAVFPEIWKSIESETSYKCDTYINKNNELKDSFVKYTKIFGQKITSISDLVPLGDNMNVRTIYNRSLPKGITNKDAVKLAYLSKWTEMVQYNNKRIGDFMTGALLKQIADNMNNASNGKSNLKYALYGDHDSSLLAMLSALGMPQTNVKNYPTYAGFIDLQLFKVNNSYNVVVNYVANNNQITNNYTDKSCSIVTNKTFTLAEFTKIADRAAKSQLKDITDYYSKELTKIVTPGDSYNYDMINSIGGILKNLK